MLVLLMHARTYPHTHTRTHAIHSRCGLQARGLVALYGPSRCGLQACGLVALCRTSLLHSIAIGLRITRRSCGR
eukprot:15457945-Alexandrium_andersonii.AAC.1